MALVVNGFTCSKVVTVTKNARARRLKSSMTQIASNRSNSDNFSSDIFVFPRRIALQKSATLITANAALTLINSDSALADIEGVATVPQSTAPPESSVQSVEGKSVTLFKTKSGLQYIELSEGICGVIFNGGVAIAADTRATAGSIVADKNCEKLHVLAPNIYCAGAGTAADCDHVTRMI